MHRRDVVSALGTVPLLAAFRWTDADVARAARAVAALRQRGTQYQPKFFTAHEYQTVRVLTDLILPRDDRSGSAADAGVPEFMDFMMQDRPDRQVPMRSGLAWLDTECRERFGKDFVSCSEADRSLVLDDIAWPARARPELRPGVAFFNSFRDLTASGFWSSKPGIADLGYMGNTAVAEWKGCPPEQLRKLGLEP